MTDDQTNNTDTSDTSPKLKKLLEENADVIADFDQENALLSSIIAGSAAGLEGTSGEDRELRLSKVIKMFESVRVEQNMPPKLFRAYIETCLEKRKFLMPVLAFAYLQQSRAGVARLEQDAELTDELAKWIIRKTIPGAEFLMNDNEHQSGVPAEKQTEPPAGGVNTAAANGGITAAPFDALARKANETQAEADLNELFGAAFALNEWHFIMRGELPNVYPYIASNPNYALNQPMIRAFTDTDRLMRFARENDLTEPDGSARMLSIPTENIIPYLEKFVAHGAKGVWFNSDSESDGFFIPIPQLQIIREHLATLHQSGTDAPVAKLKTALLIIQDGLEFASGFVSEASYLMHIFCRVPENWIEDEKLSVDAREKIYQFLYGANWRMGNEDGSRYVVLDGSSSVLDEATVKNTRWTEKQNTDDTHYRFYLVGADGTLSSVKAEEFQSAIEAESKSAETNESRENQDRLAGSGVSLNADVSFDQNLDLNQIGTVSNETLIKPFYDAIVPLLKDYQGTGDYGSLLRFEDSGKTELVENIAENAHGPYLRIRRFYYLNPKNGVRIGVNSIHSNHLRHTETNAELTVSIELCKNLDNQTAVLYHRFQGPRTDVLNLAAALQPLLESVEYQAVQ